MVTETICLNLGVFGEFYCEVTFSAYAGEAPSCDCPGEPPSIEIQSIVTFVDKPIDISGLLTKENYEAIESEIWQILN